MRAIPCRETGRYALPYGLFQSLFRPVSQCLTVAVGWSQGACQHIFTLALPSVLRVNVSGYNAEFMVCLPLAGIKAMDKALSLL